MKVKIRVLTILLCILVVLGAPIGWFYYRTHSISKTVTEGSAYGFRIGDSSKECFRRAAELYRSGAFRWVGVNYFWGDTPVRYGLSFHKVVEPTEITNGFSDWMAWSVYPFGPEENEELPSYVYSRNYVSIRFESNALTDISVHTTTAKFDVVRDRWPPTTNAPIHLKRGMSYEQVLEALRLLQAESSYAQMKLRPGGYRGVEQYDDADYERLAKWDCWKLNYPWGGGGMNCLFLKFNNDKLI